MHLNKL